LTKADKFYKILDKKKFLNALFFPLLFVGLLWAIKFIEILSGESFASFGLYPRTINGLPGMLTSPLIHGDFSHLFSNSVPLLILGTVLFYFYRGIALQVFTWIYLITGLWVWVAARSSYHIGASGVVYGLASFIFFSGVIRRDRTMMTISLLVTFLYGSIIWGVLPMEEGISWESHLLGFIAGILIAFFFRNEGPPSEKHVWIEENEEEELPYNEPLESENNPERDIYN